MSACLSQPRFQTARDALRLRHSSQTGGMLHHPLALGDRKLAEQEEALAGSGGDPVGITAAGIQKGRLRPLRSLLRKLDQLVLDLKRAERFKALQVYEFPWSSLSVLSVIV